MTTPTFETQSEYFNRMSDDGGGGLASPSEIEDNISDSFDDIGTVVTDEGDLPVTADIRPAGVFTDANSMKDYLTTGGLVVTDASSNTEAIGWVWILESFDEIINAPIWTVYIDSDTNPT